ncbi:methyl-accepting chemotaxis protein [Roseibium aestuarii]|uniref:Methyl-accepting chemotaxis protein n=1 Tax=Roseibium aestuarii TaxID=2600299 RepID=A0ABW4K276_9HYPH|nr:HAMP domain-containing methyl-accepting chemotaxis protein [Roseibium aestuarii]
MTPQKLMSGVPIPLRIGALSLLAALAIALLMGVFFYTDRALQSAGLEQSGYAALDVRAAELRVAALEMRRREKDFLLRRDEKYVTDYMTAVAAAQETLSAMQALPASEDIRADVDVLSNGLSAVAAQFERVVGAMRELGLTEEEGLQGQLRAAVHNVEKQLEAANLDGLTIKMLMMRRHEKDFMLRNDLKYIDRIDARRAEFDPLLAASGLPDAQKAEISGLMDVYQKGARAYADGKLGLDGEIARVSELFAELSPSFQRINEAATAGAQHAARSLEAVRSWSRDIFLGAGGVSLVVCLGLGVLIGRSITVPLNRMIEVMKRLTEGEFTLDVPHKETGSEIGQMARALEVFRETGLRTRELEEEQKAREIQAREEKRVMMQSLANSFDQSVGRIMGSLSSSSGALNETARSLSQVSTATSTEAESVAAASEQTSVNVQMVASAAEEMSSSISEIGRQVRNASASSQKAAEAVQQTGNQIHKLADMANRIGDVISIISEIAEQTNLLALNATIESARVGEAGKGFAVVAGEVKALATETAKATESIAGLVRDIQDETRTAVSSVEDIGKVIKDLENASAAIAAAMEEQGATTEAVARNVSEAATGIGEVTRSIQSVNGGAVQTSSASGQVMSAAQDLSSQAETMRVEVEKFLATIRAA